MRSAISRTHTNKLRQTLTITEPPRLLRLHRPLRLQEMLLGNHRRPRVLVSVRLEPQQVLRLDLEVARRLSSPEELVPRSVPEGMEDQYSGPVHLVKPNQILQFLANHLNRPLYLVTPAHPDRQGPSLDNHLRRRSLPPLGPPAHLAHQAVRSV